MAESRIQSLSIAVLLTTLAIGVAAFGLTGQRPVYIALGSLALAVGQLIRVPAPSGERLFFGVAVAVAIPLVGSDVATTVAIYAFGLAGSWLAFAGHDDTRAVHGSRFTSEAIALVALAVAYYGSITLFRVQGVEGQVAQLVSTAAGGLAWFVLRGVMRALVALDRNDLSMRYLWLLALEDWSVILSLFTAGALFGLSWPTMAWWALPVAILPYAFSHLAFVRYDGTRRTYGQTIRALAQIPEVAGLAPAGHAERTASLALAMAQELGMHPDGVVELEYAALMHDIGRITLNEPAILRAGYTDEDIARWGSQIIAEAPYLSGVAVLVRDQHRPYRVPGQERDTALRIASKVIKVASAYDQALNEQEMAPVDALERIHQGSAYEFDPEVIGSLRRVLVHRGAIAE